MQLAEGGAGARRAGAQRPSEWAARAYWPGAVLVSLLSGGKLTRLGHLQGVQGVGGRLGCSGSGEDGSLVLLQDLQPVGQIPEGPRRRLGARTRAYSPTLGAKHEGARPRPPPEKQS